MIFVGLWKNVYSVKIKHLGGRWVCYMRLLVISFNPKQDRFDICFNDYGCEIQQEKLCFGWREGDGRVQCGWVKVSQGICTLRMVVSSYVYFLSLHSIHVTELGVCSPLFSWIRILYFGLVICENHAKFSKSKSKPVFSSLYNL